MKVNNPKSSPSGSRASKRSAQGNEPRVNCRDFWLRKRDVPKRFLTRREAKRLTEILGGRASRNQLTSGTESPALSLCPSEDSTPLVDLPEQEFESFFETLLREECGDV